MYPNIHYSDFTDRDWLPLARMSGIVAVGYLKRLKPARLLGALAFDAPTNTAVRRLRGFIIESRCRCVPSLLSTRPAGRAQSRSKAKRKWSLERL